MSKERTFATGDTQTYSQVPTTTDSGDELESLLSDKSSSVKLCHEKATSVPLAVEVESKAILVPQTSAPSYFNSLKENDAPPFKLQQEEIKAKIIEGTYVTEQDTVDMIVASEKDRENGLRKFLEKLLVDRNIYPKYALSERRFVVSFMTTTIDYAAQRDFSARKLACLMTIYLASHVYFKSYYWTQPVKLWNYFVDLMIRHTIMNSPNGVEVFEPDDCYDAVTHFHTIYMNNLPLVHISVFGMYRLKFFWPFKRKL